LIDNVPVTNMAVTYVLQLLLHGKSIIWDWTYKFLCLFCLFLFHLT